MGPGRDGRLRDLSGAVRLTHAETHERCRRLGAGLRSLGLKAGDRVAVVGPNCHQYLELYLGVPAAGMVVVPLNSRHTPAELGAVLEDAGVGVLLVDRVKDMIVTGGENVYSTEVEEVLSAHPGVVRVAVFGVPDATWGEAVHAVVVTSTDVTADELVAHCRTAIAGYKVPKAVDLGREPLPKSGAGKVLKRELREPHWRGRASRVAGS